MRIVRGSVPDVGRDRAVTRGLVERLQESGEPVLRAWTPPRHVAFGRRDTVADGYDRARAAAEQREYEAVERSVGGHAVAYTGDVVAFVYGVPADGDGTGIHDRYVTATDRLKEALASVGATVREGEPANSFCPGDHSLQGDGKVAGIAQRVRREHAVVGGCVVVSERDEPEIADVLDPVYGALDVPFDPDSVGSVEAAGGPGVPSRVIEAIAVAFGDEPPDDVVEASALVDDAP